MTIGVLNRVAELADRPAGTTPQGTIPFKSLIPLEEIIADALGVGVISRRVREEYEKLIHTLGSEFEILLNADQSSLQSATLPEIAEGIMRVREGRVQIEPGYDGEYGKIKIFEQGEQQAIAPQKSLF
ncbi:MAG: PHP domain protein [Candidatus Gottesmanbacteria bacterium GW2011_GWA2_47_9]|uniref:PHP domain protein n=1 Tax=Candidatus Gottesmanbacteria bacterium GW2011_GWA2_47_9 TaxID=1618445 RepID=A0A0G1WTQ6_9BACT|nr:MAG: PHP domain protein [Candidatus Gottesmanbacteria bacterium GW2011_GWA2_47_9]